MVFGKRFRLITKIISILILVLGLSVPLLLFLNRFLIPDVSVDSLRVHYYLGFKAFHPENNRFEFFPTGIYNYSSVLQMVGYIFSIFLGYRMGTIYSVLVIYLAVIALYKIVKLYYPDIKLTDDPVAILLFVSCFLSFELYLGIATYYIDGIVAALSLWCVYFLLKYFLNKITVNLCVSAFILSILIWGKQTNLFLAVAYFIVLFIFLIRNKSDWLRTLLLSMIVALFLPGVWYLNNYLITGNPVFPYYNAIFKSRYYDFQNFGETEFGGVGLWQKIMWFYYSIFSPKRLGQAHDLFNDFKLNFYIIFGLLVVVVGRVRKIKFNYLLGLLMVGYLVWSLEFGYLRYGLVLEYLGGLILLLVYLRLGRIRYLLFIPILLWLLVQNKRVVNLSLAYDIGFRPGYFYNRLTYPKEINFLNDNKIVASREAINFSPEIYLNCSSVDMTYYALSPFNNLPVVNIEQVAHKKMVDNRYYQEMVRNRLQSKNLGISPIKFVTISAVTGMNTEYDNCKNNLKKWGMVVHGEQELKFLGYTNQTLVITWGIVSNNLYGKR